MGLFFNAADPEAPVRSGATELEQLILKILLGSGTVGFALCFSLWFSPLWFFLSGFPSAFPCLLFPLWFFPLWFFPPCFSLSGWIRKGGITPWPRTNCGGKKNCGEKKNPIVAPDGSKAGISPAKEKDPRFPSFGMSSAFPGTLRLFFPKENALNFPSGLWNLILLIAERFIPPSPSDAWIFQEFPPLLQSHLYPSGQGPSPKFASPNFKYDQALPMAWADPTDPCPAIKSSHF